ncbi:MAG: division/cell wall cluster transcriptional repressor MraZ [Pseudomonadota bacterium]
MLNVFTSTYEGSIDSKGRVSIPAPFRAKLGGGGRVFVWPSLDGSPYLEGGGEELMQSYEQLLLRMSPQDPRRRLYMHAIFTRAADLKMDDTGRIKLPAHLLEKIGVKGKLLFAGALDRFHIWKPEKYASFDEDMATAMQDNPDALHEVFDLVLKDGAQPGLTGGDL